MTKDTRQHISYYLDDLTKLCESCMVNRTHWRVRAGKSVYVACLSCMGMSENAQDCDCATDTSHKLCKD